MSAPRPLAVNATQVAAARASYRTALAANAPEFNEIDRQIAELQARKARLIEERFEALIGGAS